MAEVDERKRQEALLEGSAVYQVGEGGAAFDPLEWQGLVERRGQIIPTTEAFLTTLWSDAFESRPDDVWIVSYPKTGTTWTTQVMYHLMAAGDEVKISKFAKELIDTGLARIELMIKDEAEAHRRVDNLRDLFSPGPRLIITHLAYQEIPPHVFKTAKVIVPIRNPMDTCVSYYHFHRSNMQLGKYQGTWSDFLQTYVRGKLFWGDVFEYYKTCWEAHKNNPHVKFLHYEDLTADPTAAIEKLANFLGPSYASLGTEFFAKVAEKTSFKSMKKEMSKWFDNFEVLDQKVSPFFRKGGKGDWKNHFTVAEYEAFKRHHDEKLSDTDLVFKC